MMADQVAKELARQDGIGVRYGCHCAHIIIKHLLTISPLLARIQHLILMLFPRINLPGLVRVSLGIYNSNADVDALIQALSKITGQSGHKNSIKSASTKHVSPVLSRSEIHRQMDDFVKAIAREIYA